MIIIEDYPPNYKDIEIKFHPSPRTVFTWGDIIYNPNRVRIPKDLEVHESVHMKQQAGYPKMWWERYLVDPKFRLSQELEAYITQFRYYKKINKSWMPFARRIAGDLSSSLYGYIISYSDALWKIINSK